MITQNALTNMSGKMVQVGVFARQIPSLSTAYLQVKELTSNAHSETLKHLQNITL